MSAGAIGVEGLAELEKALFQLGSTSTARRVGQRSLMIGAVPMVDRIAELAPKDVGNLASAVKAQPSSRNRSADTAVVLIGLDPSVQPPATVPRKSGSGTYYDPGVLGVGPLQEFGTAEMEANPFFRPGFDATVEQVIVLTGRALGPEIEKSAARLARRRARAGG